MFKISREGVASREICKVCVMKKSDFIVIGCVICMPVCLSSCVIPCILFIKHLTPSMV